MRRWAARLDGQIDELWELQVAVDKWISEQARGCPGFQG